jgi:hypothetical protein
VVAAALGFLIACVLVVVVVVVVRVEKKMRPADNAGTKKRMKCGMIAPTPSLLCWTPPISPQLSKVSVVRLKAVKAARI